MYVTRILYITKIQYKNYFEKQLALNLNQVN